MARKLRVWGGMDFYENSQRRYIVAATTKKRAIELMAPLARGVLSRNHFDGWWGETGNAIELAVAREEGVWVENGVVWKRLV